MAKIKSPEELKADLSKNESEVNKETFVRAVETVNQFLSGLPVNKEHLKSAHQIISAQTRFKSAENNEKNIQLNENKFKYQLLKDYGLPTNKKDKEELIKLVAPGLKLIQ